jgi:hypothetical protein
MVTSALSKQLRFPSQGSDRHLPGEISVSEGTPIQAKAGVETVLKAGVSGGTPIQEKAGVSEGTPIQAKAWAVIKWFFLTEQ